MCDTCGCGDPEVVPIDVQERVLAGNDRQAAHNRAHFRAAGVLAVNLMGSPGSGKTALLEATARALDGRRRLRALSGDLATDNDAARLRAAGIPSLGITTGSACHLDARLVHRALHDLGAKADEHRHGDGHGEAHGHPHGDGAAEGDEPLHAARSGNEHLQTGGAGNGRLYGEGHTQAHAQGRREGQGHEHRVGHADEWLFIENVGNLVCPAIYDLGQAANVVVLSVTEGGDKPEKYPVIFRDADLVLLAKVDLLPHLDFDLDAFRASLARTMPEPRFLSISARTGRGLAPWIRWLEQQAARAAAPVPLLAAAAGARHPVA